MANESRPYSYDGESFTIAPPDNGQLQIWLVDYDDIHAVVKPVGAHQFYGNVDGAAGGPIRATVEAAVLDACGSLIQYRNTSNWSKAHHRAAAGAMDDSYNRLAVEQYHEIERAAP